jgi:hypothetical protein
MRNLPVRGAGRTMTVGELSEALSGLADTDPITINGCDVLDADPSVHGLDIDFGHDCEETRARDLLARIANKKMTRKEIDEAVKEFVLESDDRGESPPGLVA